jgi:DNA-binding response OmpR family regulator
MRILVVEDEKPIAQFVSKGLKEAGFAVDATARGDDAVLLLQAVEYDAVVLDLMLPGMDGLSVLRRLRERGNAVPVLVLTARGSTAEKVEGLDSGADDYMGKPFSIDELAARLRALLRRGGDQTALNYRVGDLTLDVVRRMALRGSRKIDLTAREFALLECLMRSPGRVITRTRICEHVWDYHFDPGTNIVNVYVQRLRRKIDDGETVKLIHTSRGAGYYIAEEA